MTQVQADARGKIYRRITNGVEDLITVKEALVIVNDAQMGARSAVREMSSQRGLHLIEYRDGTTVRLTEIDAPEETPETDDSTGRWATAASSYKAHRFTEDNRAVCNKGIRPRFHAVANNDFRTRDYYAGPNLYTICPRCDAKS